MFRIDRSLVKVSTRRMRSFDTKVEDENDFENEYENGYEEIPEEPVLDPNAIALDMFNQYISHAEQEIEEKAKALLNNARIEAAQILLESREEIDQEKKRGWQEGYTEGVREGKESFDEKVQEKIKADDAALKNVFDEIYREQERIFSEVEEETVKLALEIVKKIIGPAEDELGTVYTSLLKNTLRQMSTEGKLVIRVSPIEYERFFSSGATNIQLDSGVKVSATVIKDITLSEGDLILDSNEGTVNAGINSQLETVKIAFERAGQGGLLNESN